MTPFADTVRRNYRDWILRANAGEPFTSEQTDWLEMIRDHLVTSLRIEKGDLDYAPFDGKGGLGKMHQLFGERTEEVMEEMNEALTA